MAGKVLNIKVCSPLKLLSGLTGKYLAICHYSYNLPLPFIVKRQKPTTERQRNFCCIRTKKKTHRTFRHICLCPTQKPTLRKAKRAFILPTHQQTVDYSNTFYIEKRDIKNYLLF